MNKDALLATVIGFVVGLCLTVIIVFGPKILSKMTVINFPKISFAFLPIKNPLQKIPIKNSPPSANKTSSDSFTIVSPQPEALVTDSELSVSGTGKAGQYVVISTAEAENTVKIQDNNQFIIPVRLKEGKNSLKFYMTDFQNISAQELNVYYTSQKIN